MLNHVKLQSFKAGIEMARETIEPFIFYLRKITGFIYLEIVQQFSVYLEMYFMLLLNLVKEWPIWKFTSLCVIYTHIVSCPWKLANMLVLRGYSKVFHETWMIFTWCWYCTLFNRVVIQVFSMLCVILKATCMMLHWHATNNTSFVEHE